MAIVVLVGVDGSDPSDRAIEFARDRARAFDGSIVLAHVIPWSPYSFNTPEENAQRHERREAELRAAKEQLLDPACALVGDDVPCTAVVRHGNRAEVLVSLAREHGADHILVGRTGEGRLRTALFGSVPSQLIQIADVPVTVVP
jgi:nucleotide-binding universal stress UspA family protein